MKYFMVLFLSALVINAAYAKKSKRTWDYPLNYYKNFEVTGSEDFLKFTFDLRKDADVIKEFNNNEETGVIGYLLYEDGNIVIDESDIPTHVQGDKIINGLLPSASMGKSLVSYVTGHAICEGYIESVNEKLTGWETVQNTLFQDQILIDLLNMQAGDDKYVGERRKPREDNKLKKNRSVNVNTIPLHDVMQKYFQNSKRDIPSFNAKKPKYNYSALTTNVIMNYVIYKTGDDWENLLRKIFNEHVKVKGSVRFLQTLNVEDRGYSFESSRLRETGRYSFYANRYDYLRIAKAMLDDWHNDTCAGKYLKMLYEQRIKKNDNTKEFDDVGLYTASYGGQFHFDIFGLHKRRIIGLSGFGGQQILIDIDTKRIIVVNSLYRNYDWGKIVYNKIKN
jgi:glutaredoxin-related protein